MRAGTKRDRALWAAAVDDQWNGLRPVLSPEESLAAARKLYRHALGSSWPGKWALTSGNRRTYRIGNVFYVNPDERGERGLREIIHSISHYAHSRLHPKEAPHSLAQVRLEARLTKFAIARSWHMGALKKPEKAAPSKDVVAERYARLVARHKKWRAAAHRAERLAAKAALEMHKYALRHKDRLKEKAA